MSLYKRNDSPHWWIKVTINGRRVQQSTGTTDRQKAQEYHDKLKSRLWDETRLGVKPVRSWKEAVVRWFAERRHKATLVNDEIYLRWVDKHLGRLTLNQITRDVIDTVIQDRLSEGVSNASVNRVLEIVRAILRAATYEWEWIDRHPKVRLLPEPKRRIRWLTREEAAKLIAELPRHLAAMVVFSLETGLRKSNVTGMQWSQVDLERRTAWIHPDQAKARRAIAVPLSSKAVIVLREQVGKHPTQVFTYEGKPVRQVNTKAWKQALKRSGIEDFRWHDLRHTWASWHIQAGTPLQALQELGGWETVEMVRRYAHLSSEHLAPYVERMSGSLQLVTSQQVVSTK